MSPKAKNDDWVIPKLEDELEHFDDQLRPLLSSETAAVDSYRDLFREDAASTQERSKQRQSERRHVRTLFTDIFKIVGPEVFLICALAIPISNWRSTNPKTMIPKLRIWWKTMSCPEGFKLVAANVCEAYCFPRLVYPSVSGSTDISERQAQPHSGEPASLTGKVYELTSIDGELAVSNALSIWLTVPFDTKSPGFITISVSDKLSRRFAQQRRRMM